MSKISTARIMAIRDSALTPKFSNKWLVKGKWGSHQFRILWPNPSLINWGIVWTYGDLSLQNTITLCAEKWRQKWPSQYSGKMHESSVLTKHLKDSSQVWLCRVWRKFLCELGDYLSGRFIKLLKAVIIQNVSRLEGADLSFRYWKFAGNLIFTVTHKSSPLT